MTCKFDYFYELNFPHTKNCYNICDFYFYSDNGTNYCTSNNSCPEKFDKFIPEKKQCIEECKKDIDYKFQFRHTCFSECPSNISQISLYTNFSCDVICPKDDFFEVIETQYCVHNCTIKQRECGICRINYKNNETENKEYEDIALEKLIVELTDNNFNFSRIDSGKDIIIEQKYSINTISNNENQLLQKLENATYINLGICEDKLRNEYNISINDSLYILKIDIEQIGYRIPKIIYQLYYPLFGDNLIQLNLTVCKDDKIDLIVPVQLNDVIDIYNPESQFYKNICYTYTSDYGTDITLNDRKNDFIEKNLSVCEEDCDFVKYDNSSGKVTCSCYAKTYSNIKIGKIVIDKDKLLKKFIKIKNIMNLNVLKCYRLIFKLDAYKNNYANLIILSIILLYFATLIIFYSKGYYELMKVVDLIVYFKLYPKIENKFLNRSKNFLNNKVSINNNILKNQNSMNNKNRNNNINQFGEINSTNIISNSQQQININKNISKIIYPHNLTENQMYEMCIKINKYTDLELNELKYKNAIIIDKRTYFQYYMSLIRTKHILIFSFVPSFDYNSQILKIFLLFFNFSLNFTINALFFNDKEMHKIYEEKGSFDFIYNIPQISYSSIISAIINTIIRILALTDSKIISFKQEPYEKDINIRKEKLIKRFKIKFALFFIISFILLVFFWFYLACFCAVYRNTQIHLIKDTVISFCLWMIYPFGIYSIPGMFRIGALKDKNHDKEIMFKISKFLQFL